MKNHSHWKETSLTEHSGLEGKPIEQTREIRIVFRAPDPATWSDTPSGSPPAKDPVTIWGRDRAK